MNLIQAILMGIVQGLTEFLPISSSAHLRLTPILLGFQDPGTAFTAVIQLGTVAAVLIYFWKDLSSACLGWARSLANVEARQSHDAKVGWAVLFGSLPVIVAGLLLKKHIEGPFRSLYVLAVGMIVMGILMWAAEMYGSKKRGLDSVEAKDGWLPGLFQCLALAPGMSRSGSTLTGAFLAGFDREAATRFSFLMSVPAVAGAGLYEFVKERHNIAAVGAVPTAVATLVSFVVGYASIKFLISWISKNGVTAFTIYRVVIGLALLGALASGKLDPMAGVVEKPAVAGMQQD